MGTKIEWSDETWNPVVGCEWASPGCDGCYAAREAFGRLSGHPIYHGLSIRRTADEQPRFTGEIRLLPERLDQPIRWRRPRRIFVNSMSDLFHPDAPRGFIADVFATMGIAGQHQFQVLTKRPGRAAKLLGDEGFRLDVEERIIDRSGALANVWPLPNVWMGTSIESEEYAWRARQIAEAPAAVRFLSIEPLIGPVDPAEVLVDGIGWVIVGGESGPRARPMHPAWVYRIRDACVDRGVPFLFKQWGEWAPFGPNLGLPTPDRTVRVGTGLMVRAGKKAAGRTLDGRTWDEYPAERATV